MMSAKSVVIFLSVSITVILSGCRKDDQVLKPEIGQPANGGKDTITVGESVILHPDTKTTSGSTYNWTINNTNASSDSSLTFTPTERGDFAITYQVTNAGGTSTQNYQIHVFGKYENGFFIVNEGWYGHGAGTVNFYRYDNSALEDSVFLNENPGEDLGSETSTLGYGTVYNNKLYLLTKAGGPLVVADAFSLKETGRIPSAGDNDFRALLAIDTTKALVSTGDGIYPLNLQTVSLGEKIAGIAGEVADMTRSGNYVFTLSGNDGVNILSTSDYSVAKTIPGIVVGFAKTIDGAVWAAGDSSLIKIDPSTLDTTVIHLPFEVNGTFGFWHPGSITASTKENVVFIAYNSSYAGATAIYKYSGTGNSIGDPFITIEAGRELYGSGIGYDERKNQVVVTTVQSGYGTNYAVNELGFYDAGSGMKTDSKNYSGYYFPAIPVFHK
jgi:Domain of unknown function (DUF5074)/PKD-like domain